MEGLIALIALVSLLGSVGLSQAITIPFLESLNEKAKVDYVNFLWTLPFTCVYAVWAGKSKGRGVPFGAIAQGILFIIAIVFGLYAGKLSGKW